MKNKVTLVISVIILEFKNGSILEIDIKSVKWKRKKLWNRIVGEKSQMTVLKNTDTVWIWKHEEW